MNTGITTTGDVVNTGITTTGSVINTAIETTPQTLTAIMPILVASQEQLHELEDAIGEDINYLIDTSIIKIARDALAARFSTLAFQGVRGIPRALIGDVSSVNLTNDLESVIPGNIQMPTDMNFPTNLEDYDLMAAMLMDTNRDGKIRIREMRQAVKANRKSLTIIQRIFNVLSRRDMRQANQIRRDYNKGRITPTAYKNGVPVNTAMSGQLNQPIYPNDLGFSGNEMMAGQFNQPFTPGNSGVSFGGQGSQIGGVQPSIIGANQGTVYPDIIGAEDTQNQGRNGIFNRDNNRRSGILGRGNQQDSTVVAPTGSVLTPLGDLSDEQRDAVEEQLIASGYEVDYDNPVTLDFNHDGKIDRDERDLAVKLDREGMNTARSMLSRVTRKPERDSRQTARQYNRDNKDRGRLLGGIGNRNQNDGNAQWQGGTQIPQPSIQPYPGQTSQFGSPEDVITNQLSGGLLGSGNLNSASLNQLPGTSASVTSQRGQVSIQELIGYANNMIELEKLAAAIENGTSGIYARSEQEEMNTLKTIENTILIYQRMIEMGVGAHQEDGYYYYQISNTGVRSKEAGNSRVYPIAAYFLKRFINYLNENNVGAARDQLTYIRCYQGLPGGQKCGVREGETVYELHQWTTTKVPMNNAERQLRILLRQVNPLLANSLVSGGSNTIPTTTGVSISGLNNLGSGMDGFDNFMSGIGSSLVSIPGDVFERFRGRLRGGVANPETCPLPLADDMCEVMQDDVQKNPYVHQLLCEKYPDLIDTRQSAQLGGSSNWLFFNKFGVKYSSTPIASDNRYDVYLLSKDNGVSVEGYDNGRFMVTFDNHEMKDKRTGRTVVTVNNSQVDSPCWCVVPVKADCRNING